MIVILKLYVLTVLKGGCNMDEYSRSYLESQIIQDKIFLKQLGKRISIDIKNGDFTSIVMDLKTAFKRKEMLLLDYQLMRRYIYKK